MYDVILIHPPSIYDFREKMTFPGPFAYTVRESTNQLIIPPIGMFSIADYLERSGCKVLIDNLGARMVYDKAFDVKKHLRRSEAEIYAVGLHWIAHAQGSIEIARICKELHPNSIVLLGGLTATIFHSEIIKKFYFVDAVIRGEAEESILSFINIFDKSRKIKPVPNLTFKDESGRLIVSNSKKSNLDINHFEFTRLDLIEPKAPFFNKDMPPNFCIPICRGCIYSCASCGGSSYSYKKYLKRDKPSFRNPDKIAEDLEKLHEQGVKMVFLFQDPRMGGKNYYEELIRKIRTANISLMHLSMELFEPLNEEYIRSLSQIGIPLTLTISPETGAESVRIAHGRNYTNTELFKTIKICQKYQEKIDLIVFFMFALAYENLETINDTLKLWEKICVTNRDSKNINYAFGPMILLDPGSLAFDYPKTYGYKLIFKDLEEYIRGMQMPSWHQWISYETKFLQRTKIADLIIRLIEKSINLREKYGIYDRIQAFKERLSYVFTNRLIMQKVDQAMHLNEFERQQKLKALKETIDRNMRKIECQAELNAT
ncbi:MAG: radical SAM protein [Candidatus Bathyarchaeia archaeon]